MWSIRDQFKTSVLIELIRVWCYHVLTFVILFLMVCQTFYSKTSANNELCRAFDFSIVTFNTNLVVPAAATLVANKAAHCVQNPIVCASLCTSAWQTPTIFIGTNETKHDGYKVSIYFFTIYLFPNFALIMEDVRSRMLLLLSGINSFDLKLIPSEILLRRKLKTYLFYFSCTVEILNGA